MEHGVSSYILIRVNVLSFLFSIIIILSYPFMPLVAIISSQSVYEQNMSIFKLKESKISTSHLIVLDQAISLMWVAKLNEPPFSAPRGAIMGGCKKRRKKVGLIQLRIA